MAAERDRQAKSQEGQRTVRTASFREASVLRAREFSEDVKEWGRKAQVRAVEAWVDGKE